MLQEDDLLIVYIAYQQTYPQQLWTIKDSRLSRIFVLRRYLQFSDSEIIINLLVPARRFKQQGEDKALEIETPVSIERASTNLVS